MITPPCVYFHKDWGGIRVVGIDTVEGFVTLDIPFSCRNFTARDLKQLRKLLKELQKQLEQAELPSLD